MRRFLRSHVLSGIVLGLVFVFVLMSIRANAEEQVALSLANPIAVVTEEPTEEPPAPPVHDVEVVGFVGWARPNPNHIFALPLQNNRVRTMQMGVKVRNNSDHNETFDLTLTITDVVSGCGSTVVTAPTTVAVTLPQGGTTTVHFEVGFLCEPTGVIQNAIEFQAQATHIGAPDDVPGNNGKFTTIDVFVRARP